MGLPSEINPLHVSSTGGYQVSRSLRFRSSATAYLNRTPSSAGNRQTWTWSAWVKRGTLGVSQTLFCAGTNGTSVDLVIINFLSGDTLSFYVDTGTANYSIVTSQVFRDPSAWYHIVAVLNTPQATSSNRMLLYVNGVQVTAFGTASYTPQNNSYGVNNTVSHNIGRYVFNNTQYADCYLAEMNLIDGQALTPSSFGVYDTNGVWQPKKYSGTYGTNGFYLPFSGPTSSGFSSYYGSFNGTNQYLSIADNAAFDLGSSEFTLEAWVYRTASGAATSRNIMNQSNSGAGSNSSFYFGAGDDGICTYLSTSGSSWTNNAQTSVPIGLNRWEHVVWQRRGNTLEIYLNGVLQTITSGSASFSGTVFNSSRVVEIGTQNAAACWFSGYISNLRFVKGSAVYSANFTPPTSAATAVTNTQLLTLQNSSIIDNSTNAFTITNNNSVTTTSATVGNYWTIASDSSSNRNDWNPNNISLTAGATYDSMIDSPTNYADGGNGRGSYATFNPLVKFAPNNSSYSSGNLGMQQTGGASGAHACAISSIAVSTGKWYAEFSDDTATYDGNRFGILNIDNISNYTNSNPYIGWASDGYVIYKTSGSGNKENNGTTTSTGVTWSAGAIISIALDCDNSKCWWRVNGGSWIGGGDPATGTTPTFSITAGLRYAFAVAPYNNNGVTANFGQRPFTYTPPTGFSALNTQNLPTPTISTPNKHFNISLYNGNGGTAQNITNDSSMQPDFVWIKSRNSGSFSHRLYDVNRGAGYELYSNANNVESYVAQSLTAFLSNGFSLGTDTNNNASSTTYIGWQWKGGGSGVSNTAGTITSTVSANPTAGFSIVTYTGNGTNGATVGHGLGVKPDMVVIKGRNSSTGVSQWIIQHKSLSGGVTANTSTFTLSGYTSTIYWNLTNTAASYGFDAQVNGAGGTYVAYCWAGVPGYSAFGTYTGNGSSDGPFIYTGFRPKFVMFKNYSSTAHWTIIDSSRSAFNVAKENIFPNLASAENSTGGDYDFLSNGFKLRSVVLNETNGTSMTYIYAAFAENPFKYSRAR